MTICGGMMSRVQGDFTIGVEEEYLLVDPSTRQLVGDTRLQEEIIGQVRTSVAEDVGMAVPEFLKAQIEVGTSVCNSFTDLRERLKALRRAVAEAANRHGLAPIAASTHPSANWRTLQHTEQQRYMLLANDLQGVAQRLVICGMHVHFGIADEELRIDLMNQVSYFLPHLLVLSTSSPFWGGRKTGLKCYRLSIFDELPRTGLPERFESWGEYQRHVNALIKVGVIEDASKIWWDVRPHSRFPTLEMRIADICTYIEDGITVAALYASILSMLMRLRRGNQRWRIYANMLIQENRWRAQRYGMDKGLVDFGIGAIVDYRSLLNELIELTREDQERLGCVAEVGRAIDIAEKGTSADRQIEVYDKAREGGADEVEALNAVVDWLMKETVRDI